MSVLYNFRIKRFIPSFIPNIGSRDVTSLAAPDQSTVSWKALYCIPDYIANPECQFCNVINHVNCDEMSFWLYAMNVKSVAYTAIVRPVRNRPVLYGHEIFIQYLIQILLKQFRSRQHNWWIWNLHFHRTNLMLIVYVHVS